LVSAFKGKLVKVAVKRKDNRQLSNCLPVQRHLARDRRFNSFPRADSLLKTRRETRTVRFIGVSRYVDLANIDGARSNICFAV
jgi:hypothetical protein